MTREETIKLLKQGWKKWNAERPSEADLRWADLRGANLRGADLRWADLSGADLRWANLSGADLSWVNLREADLRGVAPPVVLLARWGQVSDELCRDLMRYDAANHPKGSKAFAAWARGGPCPYPNCEWARAANFQERRELWKPGTSQSALKLAVRLLNEKCNIKGEES